jgi:two-component system, NtrC family, sensor kinase
VVKMAMVSVVTPVHGGDRYLGVIGHDALLTDLVNRIMFEHLEGTYNLLLRSDGVLIAHPTLAKAIEERTTGPT